MKDASSIDGQSPNRLCVYLHSIMEYSCHAGILNCSFIFHNFENVCHSISVQIYSATFVLSAFIICLMKYTKPMWCKMLCLSWEAINM